MTTVSAYARPASIDEALGALEAPGAVAFGGGTTIDARPTARPALVDLQAAG